MSQELYPNLILDALRKVKYPGNGKDVVTNGMVFDDMRIEGRKVSFSLLFEKPNDAFRHSLVKACETAILTHVAKDVDIKGNIAIKVKEQAPKAERAVLPKVKNIIAVASGKGGVGKSTVASNLAVSLALEGYKVGFLDADIYGPSAPLMFGLEGARPVVGDVDGIKGVIPVEKYGIKILSIGFFVDKNDALVWRGAMATGALKQLITEAAWGELDYFVIDMPPGTSDIHLTLVQTVPITGVVIVSTPQEVALADARKGISMFTGEKINVPVLGLIENMAWFTPAELPQNKYYIFGKGGCEAMAQSLGLPFLGHIPLVQSICEGGDAGQPVALNTDSVTGMAFKDLATKVVEQIELRNSNLEPTKKVEIKYN